MVLVLIVFGAAADADNASSVKERILNLNSSTMTNRNINKC